MPEEVPANVPVALPKKGFPRPFGRYVLEKNLSRGGMGEVFLAIAKGVGHRCVIKTIRGDLTGDKEFVGRFADEAKIMVRIEQPSIIRVFDCGKVGKDYYIAMEYIHGKDLGDVLDRAYERGEPMPKELGLYVAKELLKGLDFVHNLRDERGRPMRLVHRDISPQNILIGFDGSVKLIDFGLARTELLPGRTQGALAVGKYGYMSPEQARHEKIDGRADLYSFGVMFFEVFTGDRLVDEQDQKTLWARVLNPKHRPPSTSFPDLPKEIDDLIMTCVSVKPDGRFQSAHEATRFIDRMKTRTGTVEELVKYLRFLYPQADFSPPPIPDVSAFAGGDTEKSMIIAMSEEGAKSVFGKGELPVEWTMQINMADLKAEFDRKRRRPEKKRPDPARARPPKENAHQRPVLDAPVYHEIPDDAPTTVAEAKHAIAMPEPEDTQSEQSYFTRRADSPVTAENPLGEAQRPLSDLSQFHDDEATVMMDRPPAMAERTTSGWDPDEQTQTEFIDPTQLAPQPKVIPPSEQRGPSPGSKRDQDGPSVNLREHDLVREPGKEPLREEPATATTSQMTVGTKVMLGVIAVLAVILVGLTVAVLVLR